MELFGKHRGWFLAAKSFTVLRDYPRKNQTSSKYPQSTSKKNQVSLWSKEKFILIIIQGCT